METYTKPKELVENLDYQDKRRKSLAGLRDDMIDEPIIGLINEMNKLPHCFTLQCCHGHFVYDGCSDPQNPNPLPANADISGVEYRIAYVAFCVENSRAGGTLLSALRAVCFVDRENIQFGCAEWFWKRQVNSYILQVEPERFKNEDKAILDYREALKIEKVRNEFFARLKQLLGF